MFPFLASQPPSSDARFAARPDVALLEKGPDVTYFADELCARMCVHPVLQFVNFEKVRPLVNFLYQASQHVPGSVFKNVHPFAHGGIEAKAFVDQFLEFMAGIEQDIPQLELHVQALPDSKKFFRPGWQDRVRMAAWLEFTAHYGVFRKEEMDGNGKPLPYSEHPRRAAFDGLIHKVGSVDEETFIATLLHDVFEDHEKGMFVARANGDSKPLYRLTEEFVASRHIQVQDEQAVDINRLLRYVDKVRAKEILGRKANRTEAQICLFHLLSKMSPEDFLKYGVRVLMIKMADRIDNDATIAQLAPEKFQAIWLETLYVYLSITESLEMRSSQEWFYDLLERVGADERTKHNARRREAALIHNLPEKFVQRVHEEVAARIPGFSSEELRILFRPRGIRHMKAKEIEHDVGNAYSQGLDLNNFVHFVPAADSDERNQQIKQVLHTVLAGIFPYNSPKKSYGEEKTTFGKEYSYRHDIDPNMRRTGLHQHSITSLERFRGFGYVAYRVFGDAADYTRRYHGSPHAALLLNDGDAKSALLALQQQLEACSTSLLTSLQTVDRCSIRSSGVMGSLMGVVRDMLRRVLPGVSRMLTPEERNLLLENIHASFYAMFPGMTSVPLSSSDETAPRLARSPSPISGVDVPVITAFASADPLALVSRPVSARVSVDPRDAKEMHRRRGPHATSCADFAALSSGEMKNTPFGASAALRTLEYTVDRREPDPRLGEYSLMAFDAILQQALENLRDKGIHVPEAVADAYHVYGSSQVKPSRNLP